jgi:hypothetical protein
VNAMTVSVTRKTVYARERKENASILAIVSHQEKFYELYRRCNFEITHKRLRVRHCNKRPIQSLEIGVHGHLEGIVNSSGQKSDSQHTLRIFQLDTPTMMSAEYTRAL